MYDINELVELISRNEAKYLGGGGYASVYAFDQYPEIVMKVSKSNRHCDLVEHEMHVLQDINDRLEDVRCTSNGGILSNLQSQKLEDGRCVHILDRVISPLDNGQTLQVMLGETDYSYADKRRGVIKSANLLTEFEVTNDHVRDLACNIAKLHFIVKQDANDVEVWAGRRVNDRKIKLFIGDFDLSEKIVTYDEDAVRRMVWSLNAVPYFPTAKSNPAWFGIFRKRYISVAKSVGKEDIATSVMDQYEESDA